MPERADDPTPPPARGPGIPRPGIPRPGHPRRPRAPRVVVVGDLVVDVVLAPSRPLQLATDVAGRVSFRQGGSAATTARWLARLGARTTLICAVGRDAEGRALIAAVESDGARVRATRLTGARTGRIGVLVTPGGGERSFVADRRAADGLSPRDVSASMARADVLHLPAYSLLGTPLGDAGRRAIELARTSGAIVSLDLASVGPLLAAGRTAALRLVRDARPDLLFATSHEAEAVLGAGRPLADLVELAPLVVVKRGRSGASVYLRGHDLLAFDVATAPVEASDTTGAGDAFDAGFLVAWLTAGPDDRNRSAVLRRAVLAGHRAAARQLANPGRELNL